MVVLNLYKSEMFKVHLQSICFLIVWYLENVLQS